MKKDKDKSLVSAATELRSHAEESLRSKKPGRQQKRTEEDTERLVHELEVHQVELEMQNAALRQTRDELEKSLEKYTDLYDFAPVGYFSLNRKGTISSVNLKGAGLLDIDRAKLLGKCFEQFVTKKSRTDFENFLAAIFTSHGKKACEVALVSKGNMPLSVHIEAIADASAEECQLALIDITTCKQAEDALVDSEEHLYRLAGMAVDAIIMVDDSERITYCNALAEGMFGVNAAEIIGENFHTLFIPEQMRTKASLGFEQFRHHGTGPLIGKSAEVTALRRDGTQFPLELYITAQNIKGKWHAIGIMRDITDRKLLETEIQDAREYAENIVETVREPMVVLDSKLKILTANLSFYDTFKVTPEATIGNFIYDLGNRQWDIPQLRKLFEEILPLDTVLNGYEVEHDFLDIGRKTILLNARQIFRENIGSHIILLAMEDITERKLLEAEIQDAREYAEDIVETVREPLVVLDSELKILTANHSFYDTFKVTPDETIGNFIYDLGNRQWDIPKLRVLVEEILPLDTVINGYEVDHDFLDIGRKIILLNARQIFRENIGSHIILLAMEDITDRKRLETEIQDAREYAENIVETVREPLVVMDSELKIITANHSFYDVFKVTPEDTIGNYIYDLGNRQWDIPKLRVLFEDILPLETVFNGYEVEHDFPGIGRKIIRLNAREISRKDFGSRVILLAMEDITARKLAEERISEVMRQQQAILDNIPNIAWLKNRDGRYVAVNEPFGKEFGIASKDMIGKNDHDIYPRELAVKYDKEFREVMATGARTYFEETIIDSEGNSRYVEKIETPIFNDTGKVIGIIGIAHDITSRKEVEVSLRHDSTHDALTGLYNRAYFDEELERFVQSGKFPISVVMADVNGLKTVNDTLGHDAGDQLICLAARIILRSFRAGDVVARIGGDEIAVLLPATVAILAEEVVGRIKSSPEFADGSVSIAFGVATAEDKDQLADVVKLSDARMYQDKAEQKQV